MPCNRSIKKFFWPELYLPAPNAKDKIPALDGLRGIAIITVLIYHCTPYLPIGWSGVDLFFVLSGFLLTGILLDTRKQPNFLISFFYRRALRILPLYYLLLIGAALFSIRYESTFPDYTYFFFLQGFKSALVNSYPVGSTHLNHLWSIAVEEQFYLILPVFVIFFKNNKLILTTIVAVGIAVVVKASLFIYGNFGYYTLVFARMDSLCIGSLTALVWRYHPSILRKYSVPAFYFGSAVILLFIFFGGMDYDNPYFTLGGYTVFAIVFSNLLTFSISRHNGNLIKAILETDTLRIFGKYSFGLYMYHWPIYIIGRDTVKLRLQQYFDPTTSVYLTSGIIAVSTLVVTLISYHFFEKHFLKLKDKIKSTANNKAIRHSESPVKISA